jgi:hypothetical protein
MRIATYVRSGTSKVVLDGGKKSAAGNKKKLPLRLVKSHAPLKLFFANSLSNT